MEVIICKDYAELSKKAAEIFTEQINNKPDSILGLATGSTPEGLYENLIQTYKAGKLTFKDITSFNLDEYYGLSGDDDQSYRYFMDQKLFNHVDINKDKTFVPDGLAKDINAFMDDYEKMIADKGGIDLQILGIGINGHIGFNEPSDSFSKKTSLVDLTPSTIEANSRFFDKYEDVPKKAISMGIGTIMRSRKIILMASGENKQDAIYGAVKGPISPKLSASVLQLHPDVTIIVDEAAGKKLL